ncbi:protoheme IX farnesyltransferase [Aureimonas ureilytica]|uniref:protoheme IX farnesyltransferase n=1 Tax=Aureimonas ureilytica TaxID=401562 RepID=UPI003CFB8745
MSDEREKDLVRLTQEERQSQSRRSVAIAITLTALVVLFYIVTLFKMAGNHA